MQVYTDKDLEVFEKNIDDIEAKLQIQQNELLEPTMKVKKELEKIVYDFVKDKKRKIYGGTAQNKLISIKNPKDAFYPEGDLADIDFYSPTPIEDAMELSNILFTKGYGLISAGVGIHEETYKVHAEGENVADISYVPKNLYHRMPFVEIDGINYAAPNFVMIDLYRIITDPLVSGVQRWKKTFPRIVSLQKYYPFNRATSKLPILKNENDLASLKDLSSTVLKFIQNRKSVVVTGDYAYNYYLKESGIMKDDTLGKKYKPIDHCRYEIISTNYQKDGQELYNKLKSDHPDKASDLYIVEYYPFWQFLGFRAGILYKNTEIAQIIHYNRRCMPIKVINDIQIGAYDQTLLMNMIYTFLHRVNKEEELYSYRNIMTSHLVEMRKYYFEHSGKNKTMLDESPFQQLIIECTGETMNPMYEARLIRDRRSKEGKLVVWTYRPEKEKLEKPKTTFKFMNSSGNEIRNIKNLRIVDVKHMQPDHGEPRTRGEDDIAEEEEEEIEVPEDIIKKIQRNKKFI